MSFFFTAEWDGICGGSLRDEKSGSNNKMGNFCAKM